VGESLLIPADRWRDPGELFADAGLERGEDGSLRFGGVSLEALAQSVGTPAYVYSAPAIRRRYRELEDAFEGLPHRIHYAVKANSNLAVVRLMRDLGAGADIVSAGELTRAVQAGIPAEQIVFSGVGKTEVELDAACSARIGAINLESADELEALERIVARRPGGEPAVRVGIRVNPDVPARTHPYITTGAVGIKFGVGPEEARTLARRLAANPRLELTGLAMHLGSQILEVATFARGAERLVRLVAELRAAGLESITTLDIGGGFGIRYATETPLDLRALARELAAVLGGTGLAVRLEPGRFLTGSAGLLLTRVLYRKRSGPKEFLVVDAAMNDLLRPSHYEAHHAVVEVTARGRTPRRVDVVGPVCETGDFLALDRTLPEARPGELLAVLCVGAYGFVMASNYNSRPRPPEVVIDRGRFALARPREPVDALLAGERLDPFDDGAEP
jgi:diaminopimelate decarboxylase